MKLPKIKTQDNTIKDILAFAEKSNISIIDAIVDYCFKNNLDITVIGEQIRRTELVKNKILEEAKALKAVK